MLGVRRPSIIAALESYVEQPPAPNGSAESMFPPSSKPRRTLILEQSTLHRAHRPRTNTTWLARAFHRLTFQRSPSHWGIWMKATKIPARRCSLLHSSVELTAKRLYKCQTAVMTTTPPTQSLFPCDHCTPDLMSVFPLVYC